MIYNNSNMEHKEKINRVTAYIENNLEQELSIGFLAGIAGLSVDHFNQVFRKHTGESLYKFIKRLRLEKALKYVWSSDYTAEQIALKCGFTSLSYFSSSFKKYFGVTIREEKRNAKLDNKSQFNDFKVVKRSAKYYLSIKAFTFDNIYDYSAQYFNELYNWASENIRNFNRVYTVIGHCLYEYTKAENYYTDICIELPGKIDIPENYYLLEHPPLLVLSKKTVFDPKKHDYLKYLNGIFLDMDRWIVKNKYTYNLEFPAQYNFDHFDFSDKSAKINIEINIPIKKSLEF